MSFASSAVVVVVTSVFEAVLEGFGLVVVSVEVRFVGRGVVDYGVGEVGGVIVGGVVVVGAVGG